MALRLTSRRIASTGIRSLSSQASAPTINLPQDVKASIVRNASLPNPDPAEDSASAVMVREHSKYMLATYARPPPVFVRGEGSYLWDLENRRYLDFTSGIAVNGLGHCDPGLSKLIAQQVSSRAHLVGVTWVFLVIPHLACSSFLLLVMSQLRLGVAFVLWA